MKVLVTGGAGLVGCVPVEFLVRIGIPNHARFLDRWVELSVAARGRERVPG